MRSIILVLLTIFKGKILHWCILISRNVNYLCRVFQIYFSKMARDNTEGISL